MRVSGPVSYYGFSLDETVIHIFGDTHHLVDVDPCKRCKAPECFDIVTVLKELVNNRPSSAWLLLEASGKHQRFTKKTVLYRVHKHARKWRNVTYIDVRRQQPFTTMIDVLYSLFMYINCHTKTLDADALSLMAQYCSTHKHLRRLIDACIHKHGTLVSNTLAKLAPTSRNAIMTHYNKMWQGIPKLASYDKSFARLQQKSSIPDAETCSTVFMTATALFMDVYAISCLLLAVQNHDTVVLYLGDAHATNCSKFLEAYLHQRPLAWPCRYNKDGDGVQCIRMP